MLLAIISDIHGNLEALTRAFEIINERGVDDVVCLGDVVGYGADPNECIAVVRERCSTILLGNHDAAAIDLSVAEHFTVNARLSAQWTHKVLTPENKAFLKSLPYTASRDDLFFVHSSPYEPEEWYYILSALDAARAFRYFPQRICFVGHSHYPVIFSQFGEVRRVTREERYIVNVGSVGQPRDGVPELSFGLFDVEGWRYENVRSEYDVRTAAGKIHAAGLPAALANRLLVGL